MADTYSLKLFRMTVNNLYRKISWGARAKHISKGWPALPVRSCLFGIPAARLLITSADKLPQKA